MAYTYALHFYFDQCELNALLSALNEVAECKVDCDRTTNAAALDETIGKFAKIVPAKGAKYTDSRIAVTLYESHWNGDNSISANGCTIHCNKNAMWRQ